MLKIRIDQLLLQKGLCESRTIACSLIMTGNVLVNDIPITKAGTKVDYNVNLRIKGKPMFFVSRGGIKLNHALNVFNITPNNLICFDAGASTGGFTDCLLKRNASKVYAIDVGTNQLHWKLRSDSRVISIERMNLRYWQPEKIPDLCSLLVADLSFISLRLVVPQLIVSLQCGAKAILLVKPQFEANRDEIGSGGIVRNSSVHRRIQREIWSFFQKNTRLKPLGMCESPILGTDGNKEFFIYLQLRQ